MYDWLSLKWFTNKTSLPNYSSNIILDCFFCFFRCRCFSALVSSLVFNLFKRSRQRSFDISLQFSFSLKIVEMTWNNSECQKVIISYPIIKPQKRYFSSIISEKRNALIKISTFLILKFRHKNNQETTREKQCWTNSQKKNENKINWRSYQRLRKKQFSFCQKVSTGISIGWGSRV